MTGGGITEDIVGSDCRSLLQRELGGKCRHWEARQQGVPLHYLKQAIILQIADNLVAKTKLVKGFLQFANAPSLRNKQCPLLAL